MSLFIEPISVDTMRPFVERWHYSSVMPRHNKLCYGGFQDSELRAAVSFGWGARPLHTIRKLFPSLNTTDYYEIGKLCLHDDEPRNAESQFLCAVLQRLRVDAPQLRVLFTWADGMWGKPGYVYQACNFLYGGFIWTDVYCTNDGRRLHPLQLQAERRASGKAIKARTERPSFEEQQAMGWRHYFGKQFRYALFLRGHKERKRLLRESTVEWTQDYPKHNALKWKIQAGQGSRASCEAPSFTGAVQFCRPAPMSEVL